MTCYDRAAAGLGTTGAAALFAWYVMFVSHFLFTFSMAMLHPGHDILFLVSFFFSLVYSRIGLEGSFTLSR